MLLINCPQYTSWYPLPVIVHPFSFANLSISSVTVGFELNGKNASSQVDIAFIPSFAQSINASFISFNKLIVVTITMSGFNSLSNVSAFFASVTVTPLFSPPIISPMSFPITAGFTSIAPTISPPFSNT